MLTIELHTASHVPVEAECIVPDQLAGRTLAEIERLPVQHGNRQEPLATFFRVSGDASDQQVALIGDLSRVKWVGAGMTAGGIVVEGNVGTHLGSEMAGGRITVRGNAGDWVGAEMRAGLIQVHGNAGHQVGAAYRGSRHGMTGGTILIHGSAGNEVGSTMRRGLIAIGGGCGDFPGVSMIAGSVFLFGAPGIRIGAGMKRGTIAVFGVGNPLPLLPTFRYACTYRPVFMRVYLAELAGTGFPVPPLCRHGQFARHSGDLVALGHGEILHWQPEQSS